MLDARLLWQSCVCGESGLAFATGWPLPASSRPPQAFCLLASMFGGGVALLEVNLAALVRSQQRPLPGTPLSVLPRWVSPGGPAGWGPRVSACWPAASRAEWGAPSGTDLAGKSSLPCPPCVKPGVRVLSARDTLCPRMERGWQCSSPLTRDFVSREGERKRGSCPPNAAHSRPLPLAPALRTRCQRRLWRARLPPLHGPCRFSSCVSPTSPLRFAVAAERRTRPGGHKRAGQYGGPRAAGGSRTWCALGARGAGESRRCSGVCVCPAPACP